MSDVNIKPLADRALVEPLEESASETSSGIIIPETVDKEAPNQGRVVAVGEGRTTEDGKKVAMSVKVGDKVIFSKYGNDEVKHGGKDYYIVSESSILAVIN